MKSLKDPPADTSTKKKLYDPGKPLNFTISIDETEWERIKPVETIWSDRTTLVLQPGWTDLFLDKIWLKYPLDCPFPMHSHKFFTRPGFPYLKFEGCCNQCRAPIVGKMIQKPDEFPYVIEIDTFDTRGIMHTQPRQLRHQKRIELREQVRHVKPLKFRHLQANDCLDDDGNWKQDTGKRPDLNSTAVISKVRQEVKKNDAAEYSGDIVSAVIQLAMDFPDYIRSFSTIPVVLRYWFDNQTKLWNKLAPLGFPVSIDASGKFTKPLSIIEGQKSSPIFFYNVTVRIEKKIYTLAQMLSSAHDVGEIASWLSAWIKSGALKPKEAVVDCALALLISLCMIFNHCTYVEYLNRNVLFLLGLSDVLPLCNVKRDRAHLIKASSSWNCFKNDNWTKKDFFLRVIAFSLEIEILSELEEVVIALFVVCQSQYQSSHYLKNYKFLEKKISSFDHKKFYNSENDCSENCTEKNCTILQETDYSNEKNILDDEFKDSTARQYILNLKAKADERLQQPEAKDSNVSNCYYLKSILSNLITLYTQFTAWTNIMHPFYKYGPKKVSTSTASEVYYRIHRNEYGFSSPTSLKTYILEEKPLIEGATKLGLRVWNESLSKKLAEERAQCIIVTQKSIREISDSEIPTVANEQNHFLQANEKNGSTDHLNFISDSTKEMRDRIFSIDLTKSDYMMTIKEYQCNVPFLRAQKYTLTVDEYQSLKVPNYVNGNIIDIFMSIQLQTTWKNIDVIPTSQTVFMVGDHWSKEHGDQWELYHLNYKFKDLIYVPYCYKRHWCLIIIDTVKETLTHLDPLYDNSRQRHDFKLAFDNYLMNCSASNILKKKKWRWVEHNLNLFKQKDGHSCGIIIMHYMMLFANASRRSCFPESTGFEPDKYRLEIAKLLLDSTNGSNNICIYCYNVSRPRYNLEKIECNSCDRWAHQHCVIRNSTKLVDGKCEFCT